MPSIPRAVCADCCTEMRPKTNGVTVEFQRGEPHDPQPYFKIMADTYSCPDCGRSIIIGFGANPLSEHFQKELYDKIPTDITIPPR